MQILITRPKAQAQSLKRICDHLCLKPVLLPCVEIQSDIKNNMFGKAVHQFGETDMVIVVSANAAKIAVSHWPSCEQQPLVLAIGPATAQQITNLGGQVDAIASPPDSTGLLSLPCLQAEQVENKKITLFCGRNPKLLLKETLENRGAKVSLAYCYERICPVPLTKEGWLSKVKMIEPFIVISTSVSLLENLVFMVPTEYLRLLESMPLIVISAAMVDKAKELGFSHIVQADNATVDAIEQALLGVLAGQK